MKSDAETLVKFITKVREDAQKVFKSAHNANIEFKQTSEAYRELVSRASAAFYYMDKALEAAVQAVKDEKAKAATTCPTSCDDDCETPCHEEHQVPAKRKHLEADCPSRKRPEEPAGAECGHSRDEGAKQRE